MTATGGVSAPRPDQRRATMQPLDPSQIGAHVRLEHHLTLHPPKDPQVGQTMDRIRELAKDFGHAVIDLVPEGDERYRALLAVEDACQHAIAGIARNQQPILDEIDHAARAAGDDEIQSERVVRCGPGCTEMHTYGASCQLRPRSSGGDTPYEPERESSHVDLMDADRKGGQS